MMADVTIYEHANFQGLTKALAAGEYRLFDFNDIASSIKVPPGLVAVVYEHADSAGGYGISADFLEDHADLSRFNFNDKISYVRVFSAAQPSGLVWVRNSVVNGQFVAGHWGPQSPTGQPINSVVVVSPSLPPRGATPAIPASATVENVSIPALPPFTAAAQATWNGADNRQQGIIGSDFRGIEEIGSAAFERKSNNHWIPDFVNFWYPQKQKNDHRAVVYFKRTLSGTLVDAHIADVSGTYADHDLNIDIKPGDGYQYLLTDAYPRTYTDIMSVQWNASLHHFGQPDCDGDASIAEFEFVECEIANDPDALSHLNSIFNKSLLGGGQRQLCVYGPWIYDKGHCCHAEIHPAEQIWWSDKAVGGRVYFCTLLCDESERFWWRDQMDDGTKLKPWGAPPLTGTFAIAFEMELNTPAKQFNIVVRDAYNHVTVHEGFQRHNLVYQGNTLVAVVQDPGNPVKVSFEDVGLVGATTIRGFVVLEATVGMVTQTHNKVQVTVPVAGQSPQVFDIDVPWGSDPNTVNQLAERGAFRKEGGRLLATVTQGIYGFDPIATLFDLNGVWQSGGVLGPVISTLFTSLAIDMSAHNRPPAYGTIVDEFTIIVTFPDRGTYTGKLHSSDAGGVAITPHFSAGAAHGDQLQSSTSITWSDGSTWTRAPKITVQPPQLRIGARLGDTSVGHIRVGNAGAANLIITVPPPPQGSVLAWETLDRTVVAPGATHDVMVQFEPDGPGESTAKLTIQSNTADSPHSVPLTGFIVKQGGPKNPPQ